jgi:hypothetical protein
LTVPSWRVSSLCLALTLGAPLARAQPQPVEPTDEQRAVVLFEQARIFVKSGDCKDAIPIFEVSLKLHPTVGSLLNIADCYSREGRVFSAWKSFREAERTAKDKGDERESLARDRASALEPKIPKLEIDVPPECDLPGFELRRDGELLGRNAWGNAAPIDPGSHVIEAIATGKKRWTGAVTLEATGGLEKIAVPVLEDETKIVHVLPQAPRGQRQRIIGLSLILSGVGVAAVPGTIAMVANKGKPNVVSGIFFGVGGVTVLTGGVVFFTAPKPFATAWRLEPLVGDRSAALSLVRAW